MLATRTVTPGRNLCPTCVRRTSRWTSLTLGVPMKKIFALVAVLAVIVVAGCDSPKTTPTPAKVTPATKL